MLGEKYRVQQLLALGGMGIIYGACHELTGRSVAIKLLRPELASRPDLARRVSLEARLAVEASHPNVVEVLDAGADELGTPYLVMERLYGQPLEALIGERLSLLATAQAILPVMNALVSLHGAGIVHRDIKPSNIFLSCEGDRVVPKLLDFGIAKALAAADSTLSNVAMGTPSYMAPEQALGCFTLGAPTDVWSMGVVLVRCLTGRLPFAALQRHGPSALRFGLHPEQLEHVPERVGQVLIRALKLDPRDRFQSMAEFRSALRFGLKQVDELQSWPGEEVAAFTRDEFALAAGLLLNGTGSVRGADAKADHRLARPAEMLTRTLSRVFGTARGPRFRRTALLASLGIVGATATAVAMRATQSEPSSPELELGGPTPTRTEHAPQPAPAPRQTESSRSPTPALEPVSGIAQQKPRRSKSPDPAPSKPQPEELPQASVPLGPNRSPIIE